MQFEGMALQETAESAGSAFRPTQYNASGAAIRQRETLMTGAWLGDGATAIDEDAPLTLQAAGLASSALSRMPKATLRHATPFWNRALHERRAQRLFDPVPEEYQAPNPQDEPAAANQADPLYWA